MKRLKVTLEEKFEVIITDENQKVIRSRLAYFEPITETLADGDKTIVLIDLKWD